MAILKGGINGPFSGKVGSVVGYELNGQAIIRGLPNVIKRPPSPLALINRNRMKAVSKFLTPIASIINLGYKNIAPRGSRVGTFQAAQSYHFKQAIDFDQDTVPYVNPEKALIFRGDLDLPVATSLNRDQGKLTITWESERYQSDGYCHMLLMAYDIENEALLYEEATSMRAGQLEWELPKHFEEMEQLHVYLGVHDLFTGEMSDSVYAGCV